MSSLHYNAILFDLDGTLTDPYVGISRSVAFALEEVGREPPDAKALRSWIGPPLRQSFLDYLGDESLADAAVARYRQRYGHVGMYENEVYSGIPELLSALRDTGHRLFIATSKIRVPTEGILTHFGLAGYFEAVSAPEPGDGAHKAEVIAALLPNLGTDYKRTVMVGDTTFDILGARANGLPCIAVGYGYGEPEQLRAAEPLALAASVAELQGMLLEGAAITKTLDAHRPMR